MYVQTPDAAPDPLFKEFESLAKEHGMSLQLDQGASVGFALVGFPFPDPYNNGNFAYVASVN
jgi:hypothetical protein